MYVQLFQNFYSAGRLRRQDHAAGREAGQYVQQHFGFERQFGSLQSETLAPNNTGEFIPQHGKFGSSEELRRESTTFA